MEKVGEAFEGAEEDVEGFFAAASTVPGQIAKISEAQQLLNQVFRESETPIERLKKQMDELKARADLGEFDKTPDQFLKAQSLLEGRLSDLTSKSKETSDQVNQFFSAIGQTTENSIVDAITTTQDKMEALKNFATAIMQDITRALVRSTITLPLFGDGTKENVGALRKLIGFAHGGQFTVGGRGGIDQNLVAFKASRGERVTVETPGHQGSGSVVNHMHISTGVAATVRAEILNLMPTIQEAVMAGLIDARSRGGARTF